MSTQNRAQRERGPLKSLDDFRRRFFPKAYEREKTEETTEEPNRSGAELALDLLRGIRQGLAKPTR